MLDGEEIDQTISWKRVINDTGDGSHGTYCIYFNMLSDPTKVDTDGDGFGDSQDPNAKTYDLSIDSETATAIVNFMYDYLGLVMPPVYNNAGEKITAKNKECEETKAYFDEYLWPLFDYDFNEVQSEAARDAFVEFLMEKIANE